MNVTTPLGTGSSKKRGAITGIVVSVIVAVLAMGGLIAVFINNASPYVTVAEAKTMGGDGLHVAGSIEKDTLSTDLIHNQIRFVLKDDKGQKLPIVYTGPPVSNLGNATKVVAIGGMKGNDFMSNQLLVKCPSKYDASKPASQ
jgi:cytochrome c-type biogenesis protein CcmE